MMRNLALAPLLWVAAAQPALALAQSVPVGFAPPTDRTLTYRIEQRRPVEGRISLFSTTRDLRFERAGDGYILHATLRTLDSDAPPSGAQPYLAALSPLIGVEHRFRLDGDGRIVALDNMDAVWSAVQAGLRKMMVGFAPDTPRHRSAQTVLTLFAGLSPDGRLALLSGEIQPLFLFAGDAIDGGAGRGVRTAAGSPLGRPVPVEGTLTLEKRDGDRLTLVENLVGEGVRLTMHYRLSVTTGLVEHQQRSLVMNGKHLTETRNVK